MHLLTEELKQQLPPLYSTEYTKDPTVWCKFFTPDSRFTFYITEYDGDSLFFGLTCGLEEELGYISKSEIEAARGPMGMKVERDIHFHPMPLSQVRATHP